MQKAADQTLESAGNARMEDRTRALLPYPIDAELAAAAAAGAQTLPRASGTIIFEPDDNDAAAEATNGPATGRRARLKTHIVSYGVPYSKKSSDPPPRDGVRPLASSASGSSRAPPESPCLAMAGAGSSTTIQRLLKEGHSGPDPRLSLIHI